MFKNTLIKVTQYYNTMSIYGIIVLLILVSTISVLVYGLRISVQKVNLYEQFIIERREEYIRLLSRVRELDKREMFEKDDEVGVIFSEIRDEIEEFNKLIE